MRKHYQVFAIERMCKVFNVSRSGYYDWLNRKPSARKISNQEALSLIREIYQKSRGRYGSPKITIELRNRGLPIARPRVARIMQAHGIKSVVYKRFRVQTTDSKHTYPIDFQLLDRDFAPEKTGKAWVSDMDLPRA